MARVRELPVGRPSVIGYNVRVGFVVAGIQDVQWTTVTVNAPAGWTAGGVIEFAVHWYEQHIQLNQNRYGGVEQVLGAELQTVYPQEISSPSVTAIGQPPGSRRV